VTKKEQFFRHNLVVTKDLFSHKINFSPGVLIIKMTY
jgi:hypothetical protein